MTATPNATLLATLSELVYAKIGESSSKWQARLRDEMESLEILPVATVDTADVQFVVGVRYWNRIICIRGTDSDSESITNLMSRRGLDSVIGNDPEFGPCKVHRKFSADADVVEDALQRRSIDIRDGMPTWIVGHSRGGAIALILAARSHFRHHYLGHQSNPEKLDQKVVTFCAPKAGNWSFANYCAGNVAHVRWQCAGDIVPLLPLAPFYWHDCPSEFFDHRDIYRPKASTLTRWIEWPAAIRDETRPLGLARFDRHAARHIRKLVSREESQSVNGNLLEECLI